MTSKYLNGKIYKITNTENECSYIGSTITSLNERMRSHKHDALVRQGRSKSLFYKEINRIGFNKFSIELIKLFPCNTKAELIEEENNHISTLISKVCYNSIINGKYIEESKKQMKKTQSCIALKGEDAYNFKFGWVSRNEFNKCWRFHWRSNGKVREKGFSFAKRRPENEAKELAEKYRYVIYPHATK